MDFFKEIKELAENTILYEYGDNKDQYLSLKDAFVLSSKLVRKLNTKLLKHANICKEYVEYRYSNVKSSSNIKLGNLLSKESIDAALMVGATGAVIGTSNNDASTIEGGVLGFMIYCTYKGVNVGKNEIIGLLKNNIEKTQLYSMSSDDINKALIAQFKKQDKNEIENRLNNDEDTRKLVKSFCELPEFRLKSLETKKLELSKIIEKHIKQNKIMPLNKRSYEYYKEEERLNKEIRRYTKKFKNNDLDI